MEAYRSKFVRKSGSNGTYNGTMARRECVLVMAGIESNSTQRGRDQPTVVVFGRECFQLEVVVGIGAASFDRC